MKRALALGLLILGGCAVSPEGEDEERAKAAAAYPEEAPPELAPDASHDELQRRAYLANPGLRRRYWEWRAAIEAIPIAGSVKTNVGFTFEQMFDGGSTSKELTTLGLQTDPMGNLPWPGKLAVEARRALELARAAGFRFDDARRRLAAEVHHAWLDYALTAERTRLLEESAGLSVAALEAVEARVAAGRAPRQDLLKAQDARDLADHALRSARATLPRRLAALNVLLARSPDAPLTPPASLPEAEALPADDAAWLARAAKRNPELRALARDVAARAEGERRARLEWIPDLAIGFTADLNGVARTLMGMISAPLLRYEALRAGVEQARAELEAAREARRAGELDLGSKVVSTLVELRDLDRALDLYGRVLVPRSQELVEAALSAYAAGQSPVGELLDARRARVDARLLWAELRVEREKRLADLRAWADFTNP